MTNVACLLKNLSVLHDTQIKDPVQETSQLLICSIKQDGTSICQVLKLPEMTLVIVPVIGACWGQEGVAREEGVLVPREGAVRLPVSAKKAHPLINGSNTSRYTI